jgi:mitochondrial import inner membrane translocase subunit TIM9
MATAGQLSLDVIDKDQIKSVTFTFPGFSQCSESKVMMLIFPPVQFSDFLMSYNKLSELCFNDCVNDFTLRTVRPEEDKCALNCMEKFLKMNQRISQRFQEFQMVANENVIAATQKMGN